MLQCYIVCTLMYVNVCIYKVRKKEIHYVFENQMTGMLSHLDNSTVNHRVFGNGACNETQFCHSPTGGYNEVENTGWRKTLMHFEIRKKSFLIRLICCAGHAMQLISFETRSAVIQSLLHLPSIYDWSLNWLVACGLHFLFINNIAIQVKMQKSSFLTKIYYYLLSNEFCKRT